ncbi:MAG TPA: arginine--tRNA ligase [Acholeplasma sp.]|nr:arginine--tRNA ligase [Acholeplasma sp.]
MIEKIKLQLKSEIELKLDVTDVIVETPKKGGADLAMPLFAMAKQLRKSPMDIFNTIKADILSHSEVEDVVFLNGFLNITLKRGKVAKDILNTIYLEEENYGQLPNNNKVVCIDYSSPNIAKSFSVGHLRSTVIGNSLRRIYEKRGYKVFGINHLGDWGTQFGKMIVAYQKWGNKEDIEKDPIDELQKLYVRFHEEEANDPTLEQQGRDAFKKLEDNDPEYIELWRWFREESLKEFMTMYDILNVTFDSYNGEAFYNDKMDRIVEMLENKNLLKVDEGATIVELENMTPALIKRSDGATLYMTRDLAALIYRYENYHFDKMLYVVGNEQRLHFEQLKAITNLMGYNFDIEHVNFGLILLDGKKMSTRGGKTKKLDAVIAQAVEFAKAAILEKNPNLNNQDEVAKAVGVGAIIFNDLKNERHLDVDFNLENMIKFEGQTGPYVQYSSVRIASILKNQTIDLNLVDESFYKLDHYFDIVMLLSQFPQIVDRAIEQNAPSTIARYLLQLSQAFNSFYGKQKVIVEDKGHLNANLLFVKAIRTVINEGLRLIGMTALDEM